MIPMNKQTWKVFRDFRQPFVSTVPRYLSEPLTPNSSFLIMGSSGWELTSKYRSSHPTFAKLERAFNSEEDLYLNFKVKALIFTDGSVLK
jgi:hypothetical protein